MKEMWDERFSSPEYVYGENPNAFFSFELSKLRPGDLLLPAEGEGRNAVFAASSGWKVTAVDYSPAGIKKAHQLARRKGVEIDYVISDLSEYFPNGKQFDAIGLIFAHFPSAIRQTIHKRLACSLKAGGTIILEAFSKDQLMRNTGGPRSLDLLYSAEELLEDFIGLDVELVEETLVVLDEGDFHQGEAHVVRIVARMN